MALQRDRYNPIPRILKYRRKHFRSSGSSESCLAADSDESDSDLCDHSYASDSLVDRYTQEQKRLSVDEIRQIADRYSGGESTYELASAFNCHRSTISRALKNAGIEVSHKASERKALVKCVLQMYEAFMRPVDIGKELGIGAPTVRKILHENGVRIRHSSEYGKK